jgi:hypothetical protein
MKYTIYVIILIITFSCGKTNSISNITDIITDTTKSQNEYIIYFSEKDVTKTYIGKVFVNYNQNEEKFYLSDDTLFEKDNNNKKFTGKIKIVSKILSTDKDGKQLERNVTVGLFNFKEGLFEGKQLYKVNSKTFGEIYIYTEIQPLMEMIENINYRQVGSSDKYDYKSSSFGHEYFYKIIKDNSKIFNIDLFWSNGQPIISSNYIYSSKQYLFSNISSSGILGSQYEKILMIDSGIKKIIHSTGEIGYLGRVDFEGNLKNGEFTKFENGLIGNEGKTIKQLNLNLEDELFKSYRKFFNLYPDSKSILYPNSSFTGSVNYYVNNFFNTIGEFDERLTFTSKSSDSISIYKVIEDFEGGGMVVRIKNKKDVVYGILSYNGSNGELPNIIFDPNSTGYDNKFPNSNNGKLEWDNERKNIIFTYDVLTIDNKHIVGRILIPIEKS